MGHVKDSEHRVIKTRLSAIPDMAPFTIGPTE